MPKHLLLSALLLAACGPSGPVTRTTTTTIGPAPVVLANPASQNCIALGGTVMIQSDPAGQSGYCALPGGALVEEWALYRETHP